MSPDYLLALKEIDIRVFTTVLGRKMLGVVEDAGEEGVLLRDPMLLSDDGLQILLPLSSGEVTLLRDSVIETESFASLPLKKLYLESLIRRKLESLSSCEGPLGSSHSLDKQGR